MKSLAVWQSQGSFLSPQPPALAQKQAVARAKMLGKAAPAPHHANLAAGLSHHRRSGRVRTTSPSPTHYSCHPHLTVTSPNLPVKAYLHAHVILTTVQWPGLLFFLEFVSCRTNLCDLELPLVSANLELLPR